MLLTVRQSKIMKAIGKRYSDSAQAGSVAIKQAEILGLFLAQDGLSYTKATRFDTFTMVKS